MKSRFFKKSSSSSKNENITQSTSYDSQLCDQLQKTSLNIKQRKNTPTNPTSTETIQRKSSSFTQKICCPTPSSSSSTQGIIGCSNGLFECCSNTCTSLFPTEMQLIAEGKRAYFGRIRKDIGEPSESLINYSPVLSHKQHLIEQRLLQQYGVNLSNNTTTNNNQIAQLVFTLAQQLNIKDLEIYKLKNKLKRTEKRDENFFEKLNNEVEVKENEIKENKEEIKRLRRKLKNVEIELNIATNNNFKMNNERDKSVMEEVEFERMSKEYKNNEESHKQLELQLELIKIENECQQIVPIPIEKEREEQVPSPFEEFPSPKIYSTSADSSSGISSSLKGIINEGSLKEKRQIKAQEKLNECRQKIKQLIQTTEKLQRGERLKGEDLFGVSFVKVKTKENNKNCELSEKMLDDIEEQNLKQIEGIQKDLELLHDKMTIVYAKGVIGK
uniref:Uncharacterized protein n=1 Tax=Meloidogyne enterolobii TaxID=390850 RepID=A0A6V7X4M5_MELEN|nr:unnamed protein product [Meloidogyne enterolobii]